MPRYFTRAKKARASRAGDDLWSDDIPRPHSIEVCDHEATDTGLLDARGDVIWRAPNPIGFRFSGDD